MTYDVHNVIAIFRLLKFIKYYWYNNSAWNQGMHFVTKRTYHGCNFCTCKFKIMSNHVHNLTREIIDNWQRWETSNQSSPYQLHGKNVTNIVTSSVWCIDIIKLIGNCCNNLRKMYFKCPTKLEKNTSALWLLNWQLTEQNNHKGTHGLV